MSVNKNKEAVLHCIELFNKCTLEWVDICYSKKLEWIELPMPSTPKGRKGDFNFYRQSAEQLLKLFPDRKLKILRSVAEDDCVVLEQEWHGTAAVTVGNFTSGSVYKLQVASFFTLENGLIIKQSDYSKVIV